MSNLDPNFASFSLGVIVGISLSFTICFAYLEMIEARDDSSE
jgi:hypothetical protein